MSRRRRKAKSSGFIFLGLLLLVVIGVGIGYLTGDISGTWRSESLEQALQEENQVLFQEAYKETDFEDVTWIVEPKVELKADGTKFDLYVSYQIDKTRLLEVYQAELDSQYQHIMTDAEQVASQAGADVQATLVQMYGEDYETAIKATLPNVETRIAEFDTGIADFATSNGYSYDAKTSTVSAHFAHGRINPLTRQIVYLDFLANGLVEETDFISYEKKGKELLFKEEDAHYVFQRQSSK